MQSIPLLFVWWFGNRLGEAWRISAGVEFTDKLGNLLPTFNLVFQNPAPSLHPQDMLFGVFAALALKAFMYFKAKNAKKFRHGVEYGSACWGKPEDIKPYMDKDPFQNVILSATEGLMMNSRPKNLKYARNKNTIVVGGSGSGKTFRVLKPNLLQMHSSYVVVDPKGGVVAECGKALLKNGYKLRIMNTINFTKSMHYNPFAYIHSEVDVLKLVNTLIVNTKGEGDKSGEDFWVKAERLLLTALIAFIWSEAPEEEQNFEMLLDLINSMEVREDDESFKNAVDLLFDNLAEKQPEHFAVRQYQKYKLAAGKTAKSILISCGARLAPFDIKEVREMMAYDELALDTLGDRKTALFIIMSDSDNTFSFLTALALSQLMNTLLTKADDVYGGRLPVHVRFLIDEFANVTLPSYEKFCAISRSREVSSCIFVQAISQLRAIYKDHADTIVGNMDSTVFLGGQEKTSLKEISEKLGKETIELYNTSVTKGQQESHGQNYQKLGKDLMSVDELAVMDGDKCIVQVRGVRPFFSNKYDLTTHPNYKYTSDADKKNLLDVEKFVRNPVQISPKDQFHVFSAAG